MFVTALFIYLVATAGLSLSTPLLFGAVLVDFFAWAALSNSFEAWATGTTSDQEFWNEEEK